LEDPFLEVHPWSEAVLPFLESLFLEIERLVVRVVASRGVKFQSSDHRSSVMGDPKISCIFPPCPEEEEEVHGELVLEVDGDNPIIRGITKAVAEDQQQPPQMPMLQHFQQKPEDKWK
jgi:hypothetical protein